MPEDPAAPIGASSPGYAELLGLVEQLRAEVQRALAEPTQNEYALWEDNLRLATDNQRLRQERDDAIDAEKLAVGLIGDENVRLRRVVETAAALVKQQDPDLSVAMLRSLDQT